MWLLLPLLLLMTSLNICTSTLQVCVWQELQAVRTEISSLEEQKEHISSIVKALVVSACFIIILL